MTTHRMKVIAEPSRMRRSVLEAPTPDPEYRFFRGGGDVSLCCGQCGRELVSGLQDAAHLRSVVLACPACGAFNDSGAYED